MSDTANTAVIPENSGARARKRRFGLAVCVCIALIFVWGYFRFVGRHELRSPPKQLLAQLEQQYALKWPTNYGRLDVGGYGYVALAHRENLIIAARIEVALPDLQLWNRMIEQRMDYFNIMMRVPQYEDIVSRFPWWNGHIYPAAMVERFVLSTNWIGGGRGELEVFTISTETNAVIYIRSATSK